MATRTRRPPARRKPTRRLPARSVTITLGPHGSSSTRSPRKGPSFWRLTFRLVRWVSRWTGRVAGWTGRQAIRRTAGHVSRTRATWRAWAAVKAAHGRAAAVWDLHAGTSHAAHKVNLDTPTGGDPEVRARQDDAADRFRERREQARADNIFRHVRPPWWRRALAHAGVWRLDWEAYELSLQARMAVLARRRERLAREAAPFAPTPQPAPAGWESVGRFVGGTDGWGTPDPGWETSDPNPFFSKRSTRTRGDGSMANPIRQWADLAEPNIHPLEFPEELPGHFAEVAKLLTDEAAMIEAAADSGKQGADTFGDYVEYLNTADVAASVIGPMADASEEIDTAVSLIRQAAEAMARAATLAEAAQRAAEAEYGEFEMPRFDRANAG